MQNIIEQYRSSIIQIATSYTTGTGFLLRDARVIVTNHHVVQDDREVVMEGKLLARQLAPVVFVDPKHDLAFIAAPACPDVPPVTLDNEGKVSVGDAVVAIGHPLGLKYSATQGIVSSTEHLRGDLPYIKHNAALNPGNSGGPLVNQQGAVIGVNTFIVSEGENLGFSLPVRYVMESLELWQKGGGKVGARCKQCCTVVFEDSLEGDFCPNCGAKINMPNQVDLYEPVGIARTMEEILSKCGHDVRLARRGPNVWEVRNGSANINISYFEPNGLITGDAVLCDLPTTNIDPVYEYLLRQNFELETLCLSIRGQEVVLSLVIFDRYLNLKTGMRLFRNLFDKADHFDNVLVEKFGAGWKLENGN